ncbi:HEPN domain-containing protein [Pedobacter alpinus]|uniref:HEPN domain-containing protein n=1 Tax=Pedobacter alpinus TaxID=1590643 RepID=A0ABW5TT39_9SPHI
MCPQNLVYQNEHEKVPYFSNPCLKKIKDKATEKFQSTIKIANIFYRTAGTIASQQQYSLATFMLHQATEFTLRAFINLFMGGEQKTHTIAQLKNHTSRISPTLYAVLTPSNKEEEHLFSLLEEAYLKGRYDSGFEVLPKDFNQLHDIVNTLLAAAKSEFDIYIKNLEDLINLNKRL